MVWLAKATTTKKENCHGQEGIEGGRVEIKNAIEVNQEQIKGHLNELVRQSVEETLNGL